MALRCGLVGLPGSGKTTIYRAITASVPSSFGKNEANRATVHVPDPRVSRLVAIYNPKKIVPAALDVVDIPGIAAGDTADSGRGSRLLGPLNQVDALIHIVRCHPGLTPMAPIEDIETVSLELMIADAQVLQKKIDRLAKRARSGDKDALREVTDCQTVLTGLQDGVPARKQHLSDSQRQSVSECNLLSLKPELYVANVDTHSDAEQQAADAVAAWAKEEGTEMVLIRGRDEAEIAELDPDDRSLFLAELGLGESSMERLIHAAYRLLDIVTFFTAGEREVHVWNCRRGDVAPVAAGRIHSDMENGFVRMEIIPCEDLLRHGSESAAAQAGAQRLEGKNYQVQDGDVVVVRFTASRAKQTAGARG